MFSYSKRILDLGSIKNAFGAELSVKKKSYFWNSFNKKDFEEMRKIQLILVLLLMLSRLSAQQDSIAYFLNDHGLSSYKKVVKTDLSQILKGNLMCLLEKDISGNMRMEYGVGLLTAALAEPVFNRLYRQGKNWFDEGFTSVKMKPGFSLYVSPRYVDIKFPWIYASSNLLVEYYIGQLLVTDLSFTLGYEFNLSKKLVLDVSTGIGVDLLISSDGYYYVHKHRLFNGKNADIHNTLSYHFPLNIKLGYRIH